MRRLVPVPLTAEGFAPFGTVIERPAEPGGRLINGGTSRRHDLLADLGVQAEGGHPLLTLFHAQARPFPLRLGELERHRLGSQTFVPLAGARCVIVVAAADAPLHAEALQAFQVRGDQGFVLAPGTWHHALLAIDEGDFVVIERGADTVDCDEQALDTPVELNLG
ncbi:ureidoglycolate lyase [Ideonella oryzae]|uniref:Ureidoglycolate lyase n=1 Tax=Ideonella oryzae TaxID=2937441 RepID=A0ABT1BJM0_9BURK|nr:ureidoglycolate lyase [Ideonella oryzae]MCO5975627.1 ureidoglycolate lyase [Ideonella oryzae]